jgi:uncharacterized protein YacL
MSFEFILRLIGMIVFSFGGLQLGVRLASLSGASPDVWGLVSALVGALFGLVLTPYFTTRPARLARSYLTQIPVQQLVAGVLGLIVGLVISALAALPLSLLPNPWNPIIPIVVAVGFSYLGTAIFATRRRDIMELFRGRNTSKQEAEEGSLTPSRQVLLDTSVIIDGRIADISQTGFVNGPMVVPHFVLNELQHIADSADMLRRNRGRRGLDMLNRLQKESRVPVRITDVDVEDVELVDEKLVALAKELGCAILTNDYNLNRVAELQGVLVLNINELANAVKTVYLPGEEMQVQIIQEGKELGQGVGYLDDGTMVVVEGGRSHMSQTIQATVTKVLQTAAGRMIFARPNNSH